MENQSNGWVLLGGLTLGALGGLAAGLWIAPRLNAQWRDSVEDNVTQARQRAAQVAESLRESTESMLERTRDVIDEQLTRLDEAMEAAQRAAAEKAATYRQNGELEQDPC